MRDVEVHATYGYILRLLDDTGSAKVYGAATASRRNGGRGEQVAILEKEYDTYLPSAHLEAMIIGMAELLRSTVRPMVREVRRMLAAESETGSV
jgi:hypothetical protein